MIFFCICFLSRALLLFSFVKTHTFTCTACNFTLEHFHCTAFTLHTLCIFFLTIDSFFSATIAAPSRRGRRWKQHKITTDFLQGKQTGRLVCTLFFLELAHTNTPSSRIKQMVFQCSKPGSILLLLLSCLSLLWCYPLFRCSLCIAGFFQFYLSKSRHDDRFSCLLSDFFF